MLKSAPNKDSALRFLEYLASDEAQRYFADGNNEWPSVPTVSVRNSALDAMGKFRADTLPVASVGEHVIDPPEMRGGGVDGLLEGFAVAHVNVPPRCGGRTEFVGQLREQFRLESDEGDFSSSRHISARYLCADASGGPCENRDFAFEPFLGCV